MKLAGLLLLPILAGCSGCATVADIAATAKRLEFASGGVCSGTAVGPDKVLTAQHCVRGDELRAVGGAQVTATNVASAGLDAVVVTVSGVRFDRWASRGKPLVGDRVRWFGNPMGEPEVYREGYIAKVSRKGIVVVAAICHGDSGSGLINNKGQVVGVVSAMTDRSGCTFVLASP